MPCTPTSSNATFLHQNTESPFESHRLQAGLLQILSLNLSNFKVNWGIQTNAELTLLHLDTVKGEKDVIIQSKHQACFFLSKIFWMALNSLMPLKNINFCLSFNLCGNRFPIHLSVLLYYCSTVTSYLTKSNPPIWENLVQFLFVRSTFGE